MMNIFFHHLHEVLLKQTVHPRLGHLHRPNLVGDVTALNQHHLQLTGTETTDSHYPTEIIHVYSFIHLQEELHPAQDGSRAEVCPRNTGPELGIHPGPNTSPSHNTMRTHKHLCYYYKLSKRKYKFTAHTGDMLLIGEVEGLHLLFEGVEDLAMPSHVCS